MGINIKEISDKSKTAGEILKKYKFVLIVLLAGVLIMILPFGGGKVSEKTENDLKTPEFSLEAQEKKIAEALSKIEGAGKVTIALTLKSDIEQEIAFDEDISYKTDEDGFYESDSKITAVSLQKGSGQQSPITIKYIYPCYQGALVIAQSSSPEVRLQLTEAVAALTGLSTDKITVVKGI